MTNPNQSAINILANHERNPCQNLMCLSDPLAGELGRVVRSATWNTEELERVRSENAELKAELRTASINLEGFQTLYSQNLQVMAKLQEELREERNAK